MMARLGGGVGPYRRTKERPVADRRSGKTLPSYRESGLGQLYHMPRGQPVSPQSASTLSHNPYGAWDDACPSNRMPIVRPFYGES